MVCRLILLCFEAAWTLLFTTGYMLWVLDGAVYQLANVASSVIWLLLTAILWVRMPSLVVSTRTDRSMEGCRCRLHTQRPCEHQLPTPLSVCRTQIALLMSAERCACSCRQSLTVEALGWTEFALCLVTSIATVAWLYTGRRALRDRRTYV